MLCWAGRAVGAAMGAVGPEVVQSAAPSPTAACCPRIWAVFGLLPRCQDAGGNLKALPLPCAHPADNYSEEEYESLSSEQEASDDAAPGQVPGPRRPGPQSHQLRQDPPDPSRGAGG